MRVIVIGASGPIGHAIVRGLAEHRHVTHVVCLTAETGVPEKLYCDDGAPVEWRTTDLGGDLSPHLKFADAVVYAGWLVTEVPVGPSQHQVDALTNVCARISEAGVRAFIYGSSASVYSPSPAVGRIDESWPTLGSTSSRTSAQMARSERVVDQFEDTHPIVRVVRLRAGVIVGPTLRREQRGHWSAKVVRALMVRAMTDPRRRWRYVPDMGCYVLQCIHVDDLVSALGLALTQSVRGSFNIAADPINSEVLAEVIGAKKIRVDPQRVMRLLGLASLMRLVPRPADWAERAIRPQVMDTTRAQDELGWTVGHSARSIVADWSEHVAPSREEPVGLDTPRPVVSTPAEPPDIDLVALYLLSLTYFGEIVHAVGDDQWEVTTAGDQRPWRVVASVARSQYRVALVARGHDDETIESQLPGDPLGISRPDGWDLAAERGELAVARPDGTPRRESDLSNRPLRELLPGVIYETVRDGRQLSQALGFAVEVPDELVWFSERLERSEAAAARGTADEGVTGAAP